jgi:ABC-2 type transport system ATP-binding protein
MDAVVRCDQLTKRFGRTRAVEDLTFVVLEGEVFGLLGPTGAGKTTAMRCLLGLLRPTRGDSYLFGEKVGLDGAATRARVGYVAGEVALFEKRTGRWHLDYVSGLRGGTGALQDELLSRLEFDPSRRVERLSKGDKKKLALIIGLMHDPELLLLDEPTDGLDPQARKTVLELVRERATAGATVLLSSQVLSEVDRVCHRVGIIHEGTLTDEEPVEDLASKTPTTIEVTYVERVPDHVLDDVPGAIGVERIDELRVSATVNEDVGGAVRRLLEHPIRDIEVTRAGLDEVLREYGVQQEKKDGGP